ncbi:tRNA lysidine(34) synthetase TilS [Frondihabitans australicus]|uniref:tRNA(Ile)-lysidine synthase n=1 Tax=Frondihabitans australicus TaxID=386892 RepID=A0A495IJW7_9MICO|nr:tRNA lysidine(34) synthetase TilS [Frondihabitans australicus]RKR75708.1 tRNA(Ile)-lysidine synthase [Frondihabitans australicus]
MPQRPRLTPAIADVRRAVRDWLATYVPLPDGSQDPTARPAPRLLVALSGGPDSTALAAALAFEAPRHGAGVEAGAIVVDHALQAGSERVAEEAAEQARGLGLSPVLVKRVEVGATGGPEAAARAARYEAFGQALRESGASAILLAHTLDDQAETVLLGLARGSGPTSLRGMEPASHGFGRPLLGVRRETTHAFCADSGLAAWTDPQNSDPAYTRVRVRDVVLPMLERELGPGVAEALVRTADQLREDSDALDHFAEEQAEELADHAEAGISLDVRGLAANPAALRQRLIRLAVESEFAVSLSRAQTLEVARLVTDWHGQGAVHLPGVTVVRRGGILHFEAVATP